MRYLLFSSFFLLFHAALFAQPGSKNSLPGYLHFESIKYRAAVDVIGKHLSGILVFKQDTTENSIRVVFVNEMGVTFFDISFHDDHYLYHSIMESMDKKAVKISLAKDLGMILMRGIYKNENNIGSRYKVSADCKETFELKLKRKGRVQYPCMTSAASQNQIINLGKRKKVVSVMQFFNQEQIDQHSLPDSIFVQHHTVNFTISLKQLHATE